MSQASCPTGLRGRVGAKGMARFHRCFYENTAKVLALKKDDSYLEIGFGSGEFIKRYASDVERIAGLELSKDMIEMASKANEGLVDAGKIDFRHGDGRTLPWGDGVFSAVAAIETFFFWPKPLKTLEEIHRVLQPGGRLAIDMAFNKEDGMDHGKEVKKHGMKLYSEKEMREFLSQAGFSEIEFHYYKCIKKPFGGYVVPKGMVAKGVK